MSTAQNDGTISPPTPEEQKAFRDRLKAAFSNITEEERRAYKSIDAVGKKAFLKVVRRVASTIGSLEDWVAHNEHSNPAWLTPMRELLGQAYHTDEAVTFLPAEHILQGPRQKPPRCTATPQIDTASSDPALELQNAFQRHLGEPFDHHSAFDRYEADSVEEISRLALLKAVNRAITSIAAIEERLDCENSNPIWAGPMREFLEHAQHASHEIMNRPPEPTIQASKPGW
jgi:hypothetical protein